MNKFKLEDVVFYNFSGVNKMQFYGTTEKDNTKYILFDLSYGGNYDHDELRKLLKRIHKTVEEFFEGKNVDDIISPELTWLEMQHVNLEDE
jgi:hypothetical protein